MAKIDLRLFKIIGQKYVREKGRKKLTNFPEDIKPITLVTFKLRVYRLWNQFCTLKTTDASKRGKQMWRRVFAPTSISLSNLRIYGNTISATTPVALTVFLYRMGS